MTISWYGFNYFKLQNGEESLIFNPYTLDKVTHFGKAKADMVLFSDPAKVAEVKMDAETFVVDSPGEYEVKNMFVYGRQIGQQIVYVVNFDKIKVAFLGEMEDRELTNGDLELLEDADVLILPVGDGAYLNSKQAVKLIGQIEPRVVIPSCHSAGTFKLKSDPVAVFVKEFGVKAEELDKFKVKKADLPQDDVKLVILKPSA
ncbi:MAG: hypothetical protein C3F02_01255 [Parcubacteria group bacterium]|nr:MAG: hypothetical protein C3F02_01255 [Parcubacteria group bacterium]